MKNRKLLLGLLPFLLSGCYIETRKGSSAVEDVTVNIDAELVFNTVIDENAAPYARVMWGSSSYHFPEGVKIEEKERQLEVKRMSTHKDARELISEHNTVMENIRLGNKDKITNDEISEALKKACASSFVDKLEDGTETIIGERGVGLSGGQKQRLSMARAFAKGAPVLVLDDSTSALDMETEHEVQENLSALKNSTKIVIAHRISAVRHADEIIVLEDGKISERGRHEELLEKKGYYYKTYMAQYGDVLKQLEEAN